MFERKPRYLYPNIGIAKQLSKIEDLTFWIRGDVIDGHQKHIANVRKTLRDSHVVKNGLATVDRTQKSMGHWYIYCSLTSLGKRSCAAFRQGLVWNQNEKRVDIERTLRWYANSLCYCDHGINQNIFNSINLVIHPKLISNAKFQEVKHELMLFKLSRILDDEIWYNDQFVEQMLEKE